MSLLDKKVGDLVTVARKWGFGTSGEQISGKIVKISPVKGAGRNEILIAIDESEWDKPADQIDWVRVVGTDEYDVVSKSSEPSGMT